MKRNELVKRSFLKGTVTLWITLIMVVSPIVITVQTTKADSEVKTLDTYLLSEGFEGGILPPAGWELQYTNIARTWMITSSQAHGGSKSAMVPGKAGYLQNEWLKSPTIDLTVSGIGTPTLTFFGYGDKPLTSTGHVKLYIDKAGDGFQDPADVVWDLQTDTTWSTTLWNQKTFDLAHYIGFSIRLAWRYEEQGSGDLATFYLDDITLTTPEIVPKTTLAIGQVQYGSRVGAVIENTGNYTAENIDWSISVKGGLKNGINVLTEGTIAKLKWHMHMDSSASVSSGSFFGFGRVKIEITAFTLDANPTKVTRKASGFVILNKCYPMLGLLGNQSWV